MKRKLNPGYIYIFPAVLIMVLLIGYPLIYNISLSFKDVTLANLAGNDQPFVGFQNYIELFNHELFPVALKNTFLFTIGSIAFQFIIGFALALFFSMNFKLANFLRGLMMVSWLVPLTVTAMLFQFLLSPSVGLLNHIPIYFGWIEEPIAWLSLPEYAMWGIIITNIWIGVPFNMLLLATGLNNLPKDVYEAAAIDGATWIQRFRHITLPLLKPVIMIVMMLGFIYTFKVFDLVYVMTGGGPANSTQVLSTLSYQFSFQNFDFGLGASVANILFVILLIISIIYIKMTDEDEVAS
ncbi:multiple sugar transport system permease protein [Gracilibacillus halotolerans]|uniref:Multiple sugar transport system permease protein n=1 Tax=Gracilibacillus halotolerans TaxID=74386 RepID=A0A841RKU0_9BACI|nr:sugar ABC transporter permease [Gracilibacillus halotolerans]MBB6513351.1 multiple sugar transport system permease protein [Gracilibacillus halotolerans]